MKFKLTMKNTIDGTFKYILYNTANSTMLDETGLIVFDKLPTKTTPYNKKITIQLGFSCNMTCSYCLQSKTKKSKFNEQAIKDVIAKLTLEDLATARIEFWGGEPSLYLDEIKYIVNNLPIQPYEYLMITNGTKLTIQLAKWLITHNFAIALSHDAQGQPVRGIDPLDSIESLEAIKYLHKHHNKFSINSVITNDNLSTSKRLEFFAEKLGVEPDTIIHSGEGPVYNTFLDLLGTPEIMDDVFEDLLDKGMQYGYNQQLYYKLMSSLGTSKQLNTISTKCGIDNPDKYKIIATNGKDLTCHNYDYTFDIHKVSSKGPCYICPVVHLCSGSCPAIPKDTEMFKKNCDAMRMFLLPMLRYALVVHFKGEYDLINITEI